MAATSLFAAVLLATVCCVSSSCYYYDNGNEHYCSNSCCGTSYKYCCYKYTDYSSDYYYTDYYVTSYIARVSTGAIVGIAIGSIVGVSILITICVCLCRLCCASNGSQAGRVVTARQTPGVAYIHTTEQSVQMQYPPTGQAYPLQGQQPPQGNVNQGFVPPPENYAPPAYPGIVNK